MTLGIGVGAFAWAQRSGRYPDEWDPRVAELAEFVERERGLEFEHPVTVEFLTEGEYGARTRLTETDLTAQDRRELTRQTSLLRALGLASGELDLFEAGNDMADAGTLAFYDPSTEQVVVRGTEIDVGLEVTLVHELTHVLQDQHFDLDAAFEQLDPNDNDAAARYEAYTALVEGDAMRIEFAYLDQLPSEEVDAYVSTYGDELSAAEQDLAAVPAALVAFQTAPYALGQPLVEIIAADGGNGAVNNAFEDPPSTAEHMFDPRSYLGRNTPTSLDDPDLPAGVARSTDDGPMTAVELYLLLADRVDPLQALDAADGWGNARFVSYDHDGRSCVRMTVDGDTDLDDQQLRQAFDSWAGTMVAEAGATVADLGGGHTMVETCDPGAGVEATNNQALDMLTLPAVRAQIASARSTTGSSVADGWAIGDCFVRELTPDQLIAANESDAAPELQEAITAALTACGG
ncbi:MAG: hypothetical protein ACRD2C_21990 [Acidimicrobiales bacterium]